MCGIAGISSLSRQSEDVNRRVRQMQLSILHRGPDSQGIFQSQTSATTLAHTRLSVLDVSLAGHQPMTSSDGRWSLSFNGEIYNFQALRQELTANGEQFSSATDSEVLLRLFQLRGPECISQLRGMFAFAVWDEHQQQMFLARDPLGIKPLYVAADREQLIFASELRGVMASGLVAKQLSSEGLYGYLRTGSVPEPYTLIQNVRSLPAGSWMEWHAGEVHTHRYWNIRFGDDKKRTPHATADVYAALADSVQSHWLSDVPVGVFLSSGIDSTAILALSAKAQTQPVRTFSIAFEEARMERRRFKRADWLRSSELSTQKRS